MAGLAGRKYTMISPQGWGCLRPKKDRQLGDYFPFDTIIPSMQTVAHYVPLCNLGRTWS